MVTSTDTDPNTEIVTPLDIITSTDTVTTTDVQSTSHTLTTIDIETTTETRLTTETMPNSSTVTSTTLHSLTSEHATFSTGYNMSENISHEIMHTTDIVNTTGMKYTTDIVNTSNIHINTTATSGTYIEGITGAVAALFLTLVILITLCVLVVWNMRQRNLRRLHISTLPRRKPRAIFPPGFNYAIPSRYESVMTWLSGSVYAESPVSSRHSTPVFARRLFHTSNSTPELQRYSQQGFDQYWVNNSPAYTPVSTPVLGRHTPGVNTAYNGSAGLVFIPVNTRGGNTTVK